VTDKRHHLSAKSRVGWRLEQRGERAGGHLGLEVLGVASVVEEVGVDAQGRGDLGVAEDAADLRDIQAEVDDQMTGEGVTQIMEAQRRRV
jgi:hypothetical protein